MQVIGIGCVGGGGNHINFTGYPPSVSALIYISGLFGRISIAVRKKKKHCSTQTIIYCTHRRRRGMAAEEDILPCV